jgi:hypothetical protein
MQSSPDLPETVLPITQRRGGVNDVKGIAIEVAAIELYRHSILKSSRSFDLYGVHSTKTMAA